MNPAVLAVPVASAGTSGISRRASCKPLCFFDPFRHVGLGIAKFEGRKGVIETIDPVPFVILVMITHPSNELRCNVARRELRDAPVY